MKYVLLGKQSGEWLGKHDRRNRLARAKAKELGIKIQSVLYTQGRLRLRRHRRRALARGDARLFGVVRQAGLRLLPEPPRLRRQDHGGGIEGGVAAHTDPRREGRLPTR